MLFNQFNKIHPVRGFIKCQPPNAYLSFLGCLFVLLPGSYSNSIGKTTTEGLRNGVQIFYCPASTIGFCTARVAQCAINWRTTFYDNLGWKTLWQSSSDVDMKIAAAPGVTDKLQVSLLFLSFFLLCFPAMIGLSFLYSQQSCKKYFQYL